MNSRRKLAVTKRLRKIKKSVKKLSQRRHMQYCDILLATEN